jgi:hypothetical protein
VFDTWTLKQGDTTQRVTSKEVSDWVMSLSQPSSTAPLPVLPPPGREVSLQEVSEHLFNQGVASASISQLLDQVSDFVRIGSWYERTSIPSEHETVAMLVVPLLRALGWTPQKMGIEWHKVDVALFQKLPRIDVNLRVVVEAKRMDLSCLSAESQAKRYASSRSECHRLILTDGLRYAVFRKEANGGFLLHAYMNLARLRDGYPVLDCVGAREAFLAMAPEWSGEA